MRSDAGVRQSVVAERLGISQAAYSRLETGEVEITVVKLLELCDFYGVSAVEAIKAMV